MSTPDAVEGSCLCARITLTITRFARQVLACHCTQCRKQSGNYVTATAVADADLCIVGGEHLRWFAASKTAQRGFCSHCGSLLIWKRNNSNQTSVMAGCLDTPTGLTTIAHIYTAEKSDYYSLTDGLPQFEGTNSL